MKMYKLCIDGIILNKLRTEADVDYYLNILWSLGKNAKKVEVQ